MGKDNQRRRMGRKLRNRNLRKTGAISRVGGGLKRFFGLLTPPKPNIPRNLGFWNVKAMERGERITMSDGRVYEAQMNRYGNTGGLVFIGMEKAMMEVTTSTVGGER